MPYHFVSHEAYRKWSAYKHIHGIKTKKHDYYIWIAGIKYRKTKDGLKKVKRRKRALY
jgi:hypothetical protein